MLGYLGDLWRLLRAGFVLARHDALVPREFRARMPLVFRILSACLRLGAGREADEGRNARRRPGQRLARALVRLGPAYIKLGQFLATRPDLIGAAAAADLSELKDRLPAVAPAKLHAALSAELGARARALLPLPPAKAAASVAQVHRITLAGGEVIALKVLRPGIAERITRDFRALRRGARIIERMVPASRRLAPPALIDIVARAAGRECDLRMEAAAADELGAIYRDSGFARAPGVIWDLTSRGVLALSWVEGVALTDRDGLASRDFDRKKLAADIIRCFLSSALDHGIFHADFHEGNLLLGPQNELVVVDFGIVGRLGPDERLYLAEILWGFITRDYQRLADVHFEAGYVPASHSRAEFASALRAVGEPIFGKTADQVSMSRLLLQLWDVTHLFDMRLRPELALLQKTMVQAEGVARAIDPELDIWAVSRPVVEAWIKRELGPTGRARRFVARLGAGLRAAEKWAQAAPEAGAPAHPAPATPVARMKPGLLGLGVWAMAFALWGLLALAVLANRG